MLGVLGVPVALFWFGWTARADVHFLAPIAAGIPFGLLSNEHLITASLGFPFCEYDLGQSTTFFVISTSPYPHDFGQDF